MNWRCAECGPDVPYGDDDLMCPVHMGELVPEELLARPKPPQDEEGTPCGTSGRTGPGPASDGARAWDRSRCWYCGSVPHAETNAECLTCHKALVPPRLLLRFRAGEIEGEPGTTAELCRVGPHARVFWNHPNVSRRHAVVGGDPDGAVWIQPLPTPNGTFLDGKEIADGERRTLRDGHTIRLARHAEGLAAVYAR